MTDKQLELLLFAGYKAIYKNLCAREWDKKHERIKDWDSDRDLKRLRNFNWRMKRREVSQYYIPTQESPSVETFSA